MRAGAAWMAVAAVAASTSIAGASFTGDGKRET